MRKIISINFYVTLIALYAFYNNALCQVETNGKKTSLRNGNTLGWSSLHHVINNIDTPKNINSGNSEHQGNKPQETKQSNADGKNSNDVITPTDLSLVIENGKRNGDSNSHTEEKKIESTSRNNLPNGSQEDAKTISSQTNNAQPTDNKKEDAVPTASKNINGNTLVHRQENNANPSSKVESESALTKLEEVTPEKKSAEKNNELDANASKVPVNTGNETNTNNSIDGEQANDKEITSENISKPGSQEKLPNIEVNSEINKNEDKPTNADINAQDKAEGEKKDPSNNGNNNGEQLIPNEQLEGTNTPDNAKNKESENEKNDANNQNLNDKNNLGLERDIVKNIYEFIIAELPKDNVFTKSTEEAGKNINNNDKDLVKNAEKNVENEKKEVINEQPIKNQGEINNKNEPKTEGKETFPFNSANIHNSFSKIVDNINAAQNDGNTLLSNIVNLFSNPGFISNDVKNFVKDAVYLFSAF
ncbi:conserved Plasmodium membrane protein, unknown function [Plasmodium vinckei vinckei]|uniref:Merozoite surface protein 3 n=1 Tax=Plasmodium vinckei vinckei TaxID=54757 RepID=A0A081ICC4_PLAVN|nr:conserved Plasmodium membrane protein, unknown function [Plasmodium vinckei vinckei]KEG01332.1 hypothetical protein YYE_03920 [Plasmodium vinckei vinckei]VEV55309.1 conserved Plasmodium membrane protein, unknown function [Plasmodium vinckei vinckei]